MLLINPKVTSLLARRSEMYGYHKGLLRRDGGGLLWKTDIGNQTSDRHRWLRNTGNNETIGLF